MKKTLILSLFSTLVFAHDSELSEYEKKALQELANSQIPHISYTPIKETMQEMDKKTETSGVVESCVRKIGHNNFDTSCDEISQGIGYS